MRPCFYSRSRGFAAYYQQQGYYQVEIKTSQERTGDSVHVSLVIDPGSTYRLAEIVLTGNEYFSDRQLTPLMATSTATRSWLWWRSPGGLGTG